MIQGWYSNPIHGYKVIMTVRTCDAEAIISFQSIILSFRSMNLFPVLVPYLIGEGILKNGSHGFVRILGFLPES